MALAPTNIDLSNLEFQANDDGIIGIVTVTDSDTPLSDMTVTVDDPRLQIVSDFSEGSGTVFLLRVVDGVTTIDPGDLSINLTATAPDGSLVEDFTLTAVAGTLETGGDDKFKGTKSTADFVSGLGGDDDLSGKNGNDHLSGGDGDDRLDGGNGRDVLFGDAGDDGLTGGNSNDILVGGDGNDSLNGGNSSDVLVGGAGNDILDGGNAKDLLNGGDGDDTLSGGNGVDILAGGAGNDSLTGGNGKDELAGDDGDDVLDGGNGGDTLIGGAGNDTLTGGRGPDFFVVNDVTFGNDTVTDFKVNVDTLQFDSSVFASAADVLDAAAQVGDDVVITFDASNTVTLQDVVLTNLHESDILIV